jgi:sialidase-1
MKYFLLSRFLYFRNLLIKRIMKRTLLVPAILIIITNMSCKQSEKNPFWGDGEQLFGLQEIFVGERFPNVVVAMDGSVISTWGNKTYQVRRSEDGGVTWGPVITLADPGFHGGGVTVDEESGAIFAFVEEGHPIAPLTVYKSTDHGKSWFEHDVVIHPDIKGNVPSMHMNERGITLKYGEHAGRLIRPARSYAGGNEREFWPEHYTNAIYSDDGGDTWHTSDPFPAYGTGEATLEELSDGRIYYNSRRHLSTDGLNPRMRYIAWSYDGGHTWEDMSLSDELPDGDQDRDYGLMAGLVRLPVDGHDILIYSNIDSPSGRSNGAVWASFDGGETWPVKRLVEEGGFAYSSMAAGREGTPSEGWIYLMYEGGGHPDSRAYIARFNLAWITGGQDWREYLPE